VMGALGTLPGTLPSCAGVANHYMSFLREGNA
jgi:hypothetical protein